MLFRSRKLSAKQRTRIRETIEQHTRYINQYEDPEGESVNIQLCRRKCLNFLADALDSLIVGDTKGSRKNNLSDFALLFR